MIKNFLALALLFLMSCNNQTSRNERLTNEEKQSDLANSRNPFEEIDWSKQIKNDLLGKSMEGWIFASKDEFEEVNITDL